MKNYLLIILVAAGALLSGCEEKKSHDAIKFATSADYPPFEFRDNGKLTGFDIELAELIAKELGKKASFEDIQFSSILAAVESGAVDAGISTIADTAERKKNFDFSQPYYTETLAMVNWQENPIADKSMISGKKISVQLGTTMEIWLNKHVTDAEITAVDNNNLAIESLKSKLVDGVFMDLTQAVFFSRKNSGLAYSIIAKSDDSYAIALKKGSPLTQEINKALKSLKKNGELERLKKKWL